MARRTLVLVVSIVLAFGGGLISGRLLSGGGGKAGPSAEIGATPTPTQVEGLVRVPDLGGLALSQAVQVLTTLGLKVGGLSARRNPYPDGVVLSQGASAGSTLRLGDAVPLVLSAGPHPGILLMGGQPRAGVGGTCELQMIPNNRACVGGPLLVPFEDS